MNKEKRPSPQRSVKVISYVPAKIKERFFRKIEKTPFTPSEVLRALVIWTSALSSYEITELISAFYGVQELGLKKYGKDIFLTKLGEMLENIKAEILFGEDWVKDIKEGK